MPPLGGDVERAQTIEIEPAARDDVQARRLLAVLTAYAKALAAEERDVVARLALFPAGADVALLARLASAGGVAAGSLAGLGAGGIAAIVARLGLVARVAPQRFTAHPFVAQYFRSLLDAPPEAIHEVEREHLIARLDDVRVGSSTDALLDTYETLLIHTLRAGRAEEATRRRSSTASRSPATSRIPIARAITWGTRASGRRSPARSRWCCAARLWRPGSAWRSGASPTRI